MNKSLGRKIVKVLKAYYGERASFEEELFVRNDMFSFNLDSERHYCGYIAAKKNRYGIDVLNIWKSGKHVELIELEVRRELTPPPLTKEERESRDKCIANLFRGIHSTRQENKVRDSAGR